MRICFRVEFGSLIVLRILAGEGFVGARVWVRVLGGGSQGRGRDGRWRRFEGFMEGNGDLEFLEGRMKMEEV